MEENNLAKDQVSEKLGIPPFYVSQILNGNFNFKLSKLVELSLLVGKAPMIQFETIEQIMENEEKIRRAELAQYALDYGETTALDLESLE